MILLDEPFTGVDVQTEERIIALLRELKAEGRVMLVSTHNLGSVPEFCDRTVLVKGTVLAYGPTETTFTLDNLERPSGVSSPMTSVHSCNMAKSALLRRPLTPRCVALAIPAHPRMTATRKAISRD